MIYYHLIKQLNMTAFKEDLRWDLVTGLLSVSGGGGSREWKWKGKTSRWEEEPGNVKTPLVCRGAQAFCYFNQVINVVYSLANNIKRTAFPANPSKLLQGFSST